MILDILAHRFFLNHKDTVLRNNHVYTFLLMRVSLMSAIFSASNYILYAVLVYLFVLSNIKNRSIITKIICYETSVYILSIIASFIGNYYIYAFIFLAAGFVQFVIFHKICQGHFPAHIPGFSVYTESLIRMWFGIYFIIIINTVKSLKNDDSYNIPLSDIRDIL